MAAQAPCLPYARDEASTSQPQSAYPMYPVDGSDAMSPFPDSSAAGETSVAPQYWASARHKGNQNMVNQDADYGEYLGREMEMEERAYESGTIC
jgi:hypothetical protein